MRKLWLIVKREYITRARQKSFLISTFAGPLLVFLFIGGMSFLGNLNAEKRIVYIDDPSNIMQSTPLADASDGSIYFKYLSKNNTPADNDIILHINDFSKQHTGQISFDYTSSDKLGMSAKQYIEKELSQKITDLKMLELGVDKARLLQAETKVRLNYSNQNGDASDKISAEMVLGISSLIATLMYFVLMFYGVSIMRSVIEEKSNRIVEVILSSVKPFQLMFGKIIGVGMLGLTQMLVWALMVPLSALLLAIIGGSAANMPNQAPQATEMEAMMAGLQQIPMLKIGLLVMLYFFLGYLFYGAIYAAIGAAMNEDGENQGMSMLATGPIIASFMLSFAVANEPNGTLSQIASIIPFSAPIIMPVRLLSNPPFYQIALSLISMMAAVVFVVWLAGRIYRAGILLKGKKLKAKDLLSLLK